MVCGNTNAVYTVTFHNSKSNEYIRTGQDCAEKLEMSMGDFNQFHKSMTNHLEAQAGKKKAQTILTAAGFLAAWEMYSVTVPALYAANQAHFDQDTDSNAPVVRYTPLPYEERTISDMVGKLVKYGSISEKTLNFMGILLAKIPARETQAAQRAAEKAAASDAPQGKVTVTGTILVAKYQESHFGEQYKMLVKLADGAKVWSTVPTSLGDVHKDDVVTFTATFERSKDDSKFAFAKRPTKATKVSAQVVVADQQEVA
jgi:hypothetical protein